MDNIKDKYLVRPSNDNDIFIQAKYLHADYLSGPKVLSDSLARILP